jgi:hypothetical protein
VIAVPRAASSAAELSTIAEAAWVTYAYNQIDHAQKGLVDPEFL